MNNDSKKTIAKEVLIFISTCLFCILSYLTFIGYESYQNSIKEEKIKKNEIKIVKLNLENDTLIKLYKNLIKSNLDVPETYESFINTLSENINLRKKYYKYLIQNNYKDIPNTFEQFNILYFDPKYIKRKTDLEIEINSLEKSIIKVKNDNYKTNKMFYTFFSIVFLLVYPLRFIFILIRWSIRTLSN